MKPFQFLRQALIAATASACLINISYAADALKMELQANKIVKSADGEISYISASNAQKGETVQYRATYTNVIDQPISDVTVTLPIPASMTFTGEAQPSSAQASIDGKNYAEMPLMRKIDGKFVKVPLSEYKALRWNIKLLPAKKSADVSLNTIVN
ncbi:hypothetical protein J3492_00465 [Psychrobacter sp. F1192]|uniref:Repeat protein (TIGR01451 family) n=1 Tax=Psychrobacter coccoides TaxID=2818440 RepID=A0ABS3NJW9_9GAMM|nr:hypothetical protein [Psychrobacter coccoides]MBO1529686.1 hypothetical protein [Psychrobacter coccoides]